MVSKLHTKKLNEFSWSLFDDAKGIQELCITHNYDSFRFPDKAHEMFKTMKQRVELASASGLAVNIVYKKWRGHRYIQSLNVEPKDDTLKEQYVSLKEVEQGSVAASPQVIDHTL